MNAIFGKINKAASFAKTNRLFIGAGMAGIGLYNASNAVDKMRSGDGAGAMLSGALAAGAGVASHTALMNQTLYRQHVRNAQNVLKGNAKKMF